MLNIEKPEVHEQLINKVFGDVEFSLIDRSNGDDYDGQGYSHALYVADPERREIMFNVAIAKWQREVVISMRTGDTYEYEHFTITVDGFCEFKKLLELEGLTEDELPTKYIIKYAGDKNFGRISWHNVDAEEVYEETLMKKYEWFLNGFKEKYWGDR